MKRSVNNWLSVKAGMRGMTGMREISVGMMGMGGIRVRMMGMRGIRVEKLGIRVGMQKVGVGMREIGVGIWGIGRRNEGSQGENLRIGAELVI